MGKYRTRAREVGEVDLEAWRREADELEELADVGRAYLISQCRERLSEGRAKFARRQAELEARRQRRDQEATS